MQEQNIASVKRRIAGGIIDVIFTISLWLFFGLLLGQIMGESYITKVNGETMLTVREPSVSTSAFLTFITFVIMEWKLGKSPGKMLFGMKIISEDGSDITFFQSFGRNILRIIDALFVYLAGIIIMAFDKKNQRFGDLVSKTVVVRS